MFEKELTAAVALRRIQSPYLIRPLASALNVPPYHGPCIAFEFAKGGTLYTLLRTDEEARSVGEGNSVTGILSASERVGLAEDVARGLAAMHEAGWAHLDIKDHNIVVEPSRETQKLRQYGRCRCNCQGVRIQRLHGRFQQNSGSAHGRGTRKSRWRELVVLHLSGHCMRTSPQQPDRTYKPPSRAANSACWACRRFSA